MEKELSTKNNNYKEKLIELISNINQEEILEYLYCFIKGKIKAED